MILILNPNPFHQFKPTTPLNLNTALQLYFKIGKIKNRVEATSNRVKNIQAIEAVSLTVQDPAVKSSINKSNRSKQSSRPVQAFTVVINGNKP